MVQNHCPAIVCLGTRNLCVILVVFLSVLFPRTPLLAAETFRFHVPPSTSELPENPGVTCEASLVLMGLENDTTYALYDLDDPASDPVTSGQLERYESETIAPDIMTPNGYYQLETSHMVSAYIGDDCLGQGMSGSFFYHTRDGRSFIGDDFVINIPQLGSNSEFVVFAYQDASVTIENTGGSTVASERMTADTYWKPTGLSANRFYRVTSTGRISLQSNARSGYSTIPGEYPDNLTSCYNDAATEFLFATWEGDKSNVIVVFAHESANITLWDLTDPQDKGTPAILLAGETWRHEAGGTEPGYWLLETDGGKRVSVRAGSETSDIAGAYMGDDIAFSAGFNSYSHPLHSITQGGTVFVNNDQTTVDVTDLAVGRTTSVLDAADYLVLEADVDWLIQSDLPSSVETMGGIPTESSVVLTSFGSFVPPNFVLDANDNKVHDHVEDLDKDGNPNVCDLDDDGDGIPDDKDNCPEAAEDFDGDLDEDGCPETPGDRDGDGIPDSEDTCPDRPEDMDGDADEDGCPETTDDRDGDGIPNLEDPCPDVAEDFDGEYDEDGCPETDDDRDGDGIADGDDNCPNTYNPNQEDTDNDGVGDACEDGDGGSLPGVGATGTGATFSCSASPRAQRGVRAQSHGLLLRLILQLEII